MVQARGVSAHHLAQADLRPPGLRAERVRLHLGRHAGRLNEGPRTGAGAEGVGRPRRSLARAAEGTGDGLRRAALLSCAGSQTGPFKKAVFRSRLSPRCILWPLRMAFVG